MSIEDRVKGAIEEQLARVVPPAPDVDAVVGRQRQRSTVRLVAVPVAVTALVGGVVGGADLLVGGNGGAAQAESLGSFDFSEGLRSYMSPDENGGIYIAGRRFDSERLADIDTDATATSYGMVYFDGDGQVHLLDEQGYRKAIGPVPDEAPDPPEPKTTVRRLQVDADTDASATLAATETRTSSTSGYRPSAKADTTGPMVAWTEYYGDHVTIRMYDLATGEDVGTHDVPCSGGCAGVRVDAVDGGVAYVSTPDGRYAWDPSTGTGGWTRIAGSDTQIVDVHNKTILYVGERPDLAAGGPVDASWRTERAPAEDAELSHDGRHVLYWSPKLKPTAAGGDGVRLDVPNAAKQFSFDTDGSVLAATNGEQGTARVWDCDVRSGACTRLDDVSVEHGDVIFVGNDR